MQEPIKIGIITCDNRCVKTYICPGGKCLRALRNREGAFDIYKGKEVELVGLISCGGCPGGYLEVAPAKMKDEGAQVIHFTTEFIVGFPPCPYITYMRDFIKNRYEMEVVIGTGPIPQKDYIIHMELGTWNSPEWKELIQPTLTDEKTRLAYN